MIKPKLIVAIPSLKRPDTLYYTLRTVLNQDYDNYSIVVSDNFSNDNTAEVVAAFKSDKITYINPGRKLSMSHHWEFMLENIRGGYVTVLGDDDGLLPGGLSRVAAILAKHPLEAIGWRFGNFNWKGLPPHFMIPMANYYRKIEAAVEIKKIFASESIYHTMRFPSLYGGFINTELIAGLKNKFGGKFFHSRIPDFFSGALVAASVKNYIRAEFPVTINATSRHSTGFATINPGNGESAFTDLQKKEENILFHKDLVFIRSNAIPIAEAMLQVHDLVPSFPRIDFKKLLTEVVREASVAQTKEKFIELINGVSEIAEMNGLGEFIHPLVTEVKHQPREHAIKKKFSPVSLSLYINPRDTGIDTVEDACNFAASVIPAHFFEQKASPMKIFSTLAAMGKYIYLRSISSKRRYL